jgi:hypothetical protein
MAEAAEADPARGASASRFLLLSVVELGRNGPRNETFLRSAAKPSFSYSGLPWSVANSVTVASSPAARSRCSMSAWPSPRRP